MEFISTLSTAFDPAAAVEEVVAEINSRIPAPQIDLLLVFASGHEPEEFETLAERLLTAFPRAMTLGCTAESTICSHREIERTQSLVVLAAALPDVRIGGFHLDPELESLEDPLSALSEIEPESQPVFLAFGDSYSFDVQSFLDHFNASYPGCSLLGGMASAGRTPGQNRLLLGSKIYSVGLVGLRLDGNIRVESVVSQGCRPIGRHFVVTEGTQNTILKLGGRPAVEVFTELYEKLSAAEKELLQNGLFVGRVIDEHKRPLERGDFLIHGVMAFDKEKGSIGMAGPVRRGITVQFHVRDSACADEDLRQLLQPHAAGAQAEPASGAVLFSCNGRGTRMWSEAGHDAGVFREICGRIPVAGFFCAGELGPVGGRSFIHGFTASIGLFKPKLKTPAET